MLVNYMESFIKNGSSDKDLSYEYSIYYNGSKVINYHNIPNALTGTYNFNPQQFVVIQMN